MLTVTIADVQAIRPLATNIGTGTGQDRFTMYVQEARMIDIQPAITAHLLNEIDNDNTSPLTYAELVNGGTYTHETKTYMFAGLKKALAYFVYARLVKANPLLVTAFGAVNKVDPNSERADAKQLSNAANDAQAIADAYLQDCLLYIKQKFTTEEPNDVPDSKRFNITAIGD